MRFWQMVLWPRESLLRWGGVFLGVFLATHWQEVTSPTFNVDDWGLIGTNFSMARQSRPGWDLVYGFLFQNSFSPFFGWLIAAASLYALAAVTTVFCRVVTPPWLCLLALLISSHPYLLDLFSFSYAIGIYLLAAPLSAWGGVLMAYNPGPPLLKRRWLDGVLGVLLFALAMGIYQPTGYVGIALPALHGLGRALGPRGFPAQAILKLLVGVTSGGLLYYGWSLVARQGTEASTRTGIADLPRFLEKLTDLSVYQEIYSTSVPLLPTTPQRLLAIVFFVTLTLATAWIVRVTPIGSERRIRLGLLWLSAGFLTLLPLLLFFLLQADFPSRAFCLGNLGIASFSVIVLAHLQSVGDFGGSAGIFRARFLSRFLVGLLIVGYLIPQAAFASKVWDLTQLLERRDIAFSNSIVADVRNMASKDGSAADPFIVFGTTERNEPFQHWSSVGASAFRREWTIPDLFRQLHGVKVEHIGYRGSTEEEVRRSLPPCRAYPESGSIVPHKGRWLVCLEANPPADASP
jgi:hypothetical protein